MLESLTYPGDLNSLVLGLTLGAVIAASLTALLMQRRHRTSRDESTRLKRSLRHTQVQLDQARKNAEALEVEVLEWRRRSSLRTTRSAGSSRFAAAAPAQPEAWVIGALLDGDSGPGEFAETQILPSNRATLSFS